MVMIFINLYIGALAYEHATFIDGYYISVTQLMLDK
jgi:hypothetical protein